MWAGLLALAVSIAACSVPTAPPTAAAPQPAPAIVHEGSTTAATDQPGPALRIRRPAELGAGAVLLAQVATRGRAIATLTPPDGWTEVAVTRRGGQLASWIFFRVVGGSEPEAYEFAASSPSPMVGSISAFSHVDAANPVDTFAGIVNGSSTQLQGPALATDRGNTVALWLGTQLLVTNGCPPSPIEPPSGFSTAGANCSPAGPGLNLSLAFRQLGAGSVQPRWSGRSPTAADSVVQVIALRPVGSPGGDGRVPAAQVADRYASRPAPSLSDPAKYGYLLWDGVGPDNQKDVNIGADVLYQPSGLAASRIDPEVLYANSEKDRGTMVAISTRDAKVLGRYTVQIPGLFDWEDLASGPCPTGSCLFAGDIGAAREVAKPGAVFSVTRFPEPNVSGGQTAGVLTGETFPYTYPGAKVADAEAMLVHPWTGDIYVITKSASGVSDVYRFPTPLPAPGVVSELVKVATLTLPLVAGDPEAAKVTAAAVHPVANRFLVRTYRHVFEYRGPEGGSFADAFTGERVELTDPGEGQGEAVTYAVDGSAYYTLSEAAKPPYRLNRVDRG